MGPSVAFDSSIPLGYVPYKWTHSGLFIANFFLNMRDTLKMGPARFKGDKLGSSVVFDSSVPLGFILTPVFRKIHSLQTDPFWRVLSRFFP